MRIQIPVNIISTKMNVSFCVQNGVCLHREPVHPPGVGARQLPQVRHGRRHRPGRALGQVLGRQPRPPQVSRYTYLSVFIYNISIPSGSLSVLCNNKELKTFIMEELRSLGQMQQLSSYEKVTIKMQHSSRYSFQYSRSV